MVVALLSSMYPAMEVLYYVCLSGESSEIPSHLDSSTCIMGRAMLRHAGPAAALPCPMQLQRGDPLAVIDASEIPCAVRTLCFVFSNVCASDDDADWGRPSLWSVIDATEGRILS